MGAKKNKNKVVRLRNKLLKRATLKEKTIAYFKNGGTLENFKSPYKKIARPL